MCVLRFWTEQNQNSVTDLRKQKPSIKGLRNDAKSVNALVGQPSSIEQPDKGQLDISIHKKWPGVISLSLCRSIKLINSIYIKITTPSAKEQHCQQAKVC